MSKILILTNTFPYPGGDDFLRSEISYWSQEQDTVIVAPRRRTSGEPLILPSNITVDHSIANRSSVLWKLLFISLAFFSPVFWRELRGLDARQLLNLRVLRGVTLTSGRTLNASLGIRRMILRHGRFDLAYSYWKDAESFAAAIWRRRGKVGCLVTRAHRYDVYPQRHLGGHLPLSRQFSLDFDRIYPVSHDGRLAITASGHARPDQISVSRLGVLLPEDRSFPSGGKNLSVLSISNCISVKRLDRILDGLARCSQLMPEVALSWTHIGDGPLLPELRLSAAQLASTRNIVVDLRGRLEREEIDSLLAAQPFDVLVNTSESEGIPVSIMEAMSFGIPCIAPRVGGVDEIVDSSCGWLLSESPTGHEIAQVLSMAYSKAKSPAFRLEARRRIEEQFRADVAFPQFVESCREQMHLVADRPA